MKYAVDMGYDNDPLMIEAGSFRLGDYSNQLRFFAGKDPQTEVVAVIHPEHWASVTKVEEPTE